MDYYFLNHENREHCVFLHIMQLANEDQLENSTKGCTLICPGALWETISVFVLLGLGSFRDLI